MGHQGNRFIGLLLWVVGSYTNKGFNQAAEAEFFSMWSPVVICRICLGSGVNCTNQLLVGPRSIIINSCYCPLVVQCFVL